MFAVWLDVLPLLKVTAPPPLPQDVLHAAGVTGVGMVVIQLRVYIILHHRILLHHNILRAVLEQEERLEANRDAILNQDGQAIIPHSCIRRRKFVH